MEKIIDKILFTEKYRPQTIRELIVPQRIRTVLENGVVQNLLLHGTAGIGKTSCAKAICKTFGHNYLYLNMSETTGVDTIRETITEFAFNQQVFGGDNPIKVVIMDEMDGMSAQAYNALRATMEKCAMNTRFIGTCNYLQKVPEPIQSRFQLIDFNFTQEETTEIKKQQVRRIVEICRKEEMNITPQAALKMVQTYFPDFRSIVSHLQNYKLQGMKQIEEGNVKDSASEFAELFDLCIEGDDPIENYKFVIKNYSNNVDEAITALGRDFVEYIKLKKPNLIPKIPTICILSAGYQQKLKNCIDPVVVLLANVYELQQELQK